MTRVADFHIEYHRFIDEEGNHLQELPPFAQNREELLKLFRLLHLVRLFDAKTVSLQRMGKMGTFASSLGQEAVSVAIGSAMQPQDVLCPYYRDQGALLQRGVSMAQIMAFWGGDERGSLFHPESQDFPIAIPISTQLTHAAGVAYAIKLRKEKRVAVSACGDGGTSKGDFYEAVNAGGTWKLPLVLVVNNNQWAISVPRKKQSGAQTLAQKALAGGIRGVQVDGNDLIACKAVLEEAIANARQGGGATLVEAITYRLCDHTTADDATRYISKEEIEEAWRHEPIVRMRNFLAKRGWLDAAQEEEILTSCRAEVDQAVKEYVARQPQEPQSMFEHLFAKLPQAYLGQKNSLPKRSS